MKTSAMNKRQRWFFEKKLNRLRSLKDTLYSKYKSTGQEIQQIEDLLRQDQVDKLIHGKATNA